MRRDWKYTNLVGWKLFYADDAIVTSAQMRFDDAPPRGVEVLKKYYTRANGGYTHENQNGLDLYILNSVDALKVPLPPQVKLGMNLTQPEFHRILALAKADTETITTMI